MYLSLPIPLLNSKVSLEDCIKEFIKEEMLDEKEYWYCI